MSPWDLLFVDCFKPHLEAVQEEWCPALEAAGSRKTHPLGYTMKANFTCEESTRALSAAAPTGGVRFLKVEKVFRPIRTI